MDHPHSTGNNDLNNHKDPSDADCDDNDDNSNHAEVLTAKVVIVGAGASGLQCAQRLLENKNGFEPQDIVILEARDRIGGRIYTTTETTTTITTTGGAENQVPLVRDHGAAWVHGTGVDWNVPIRPPNNNKKQQQQRSRSHTINPMMHLLQQETELATQQQQQSTTSVYERHLNNLQLKGNPWMRPNAILHQHDQWAVFVAGRSFWKNNNNVTTASADNDDIGDSIPQQAVRRHFEILRHVHRLGKHYQDEQEEDNTTTRISLAQAIAVVVQEHYSSQDKNDDEKWVQALTPLYMHLVECWYGKEAEQLQLWEFTWDDDEEGESDDDEDIGDFDKEYDNEGDFFGPHCTLKHGMCRVLEPLLQNGVQDQIRLQEPVSRIVRQSESSLPGGDRSVTVHTTTGLKVQASVACVVTIPAGCLRDTASSLFFDSSSSSSSPSISPAKMEAIQSLQMGSYKKVFLTFDSIFWPSEPALIGMVRQLPESNNTTTVITEPLGNYLLFDNLWARDGIPSIEAVLVGKSATWATHKSDSEICNAILEFMQDAMGVLASGRTITTSSSSSSSAEIPENVAETTDGQRKLQERLVSCHVTRWEEDPYSRGAYSSISLGRLERHNQELRRPEWGGKLIFSGEATVSEFEGSVHAALMSGTSAANTVLEQL